jgi:hypothetical protein
VPYVSSSSGSLFAEGGAGTLRLLVYLTLALILMVADHRGGYRSGYGTGPACSAVRSTSPRRRRRDSPKACTTPSARAPSSMTRTRRCANSC